MAPDGPKEISDALTMLGKFAAALRKGNEAAPRIRSLGEYALREVWSRAYPRSFAVPPDIEKTLDYHWKEIHGLRLNDIPSVTNLISSLASLVREIERGIRFELTDAPELWCDLLNLNHQIEHSETLVEAVKVIRAVTDLIDKDSNRPETPGSVFRAKSSILSNVGDSLFDDSISVCTACTLANLILSISYELQDANPPRYFRVAFSPPTRHGKMRGHIRARIVAEELDEVIVDLIEHQHLIWTRGRLVGPIGITLQRAKESLDRIEPDSISLGFAECTRDIDRLFEWIKESDDPPSLFTKEAVHAYLSLAIYYLKEVHNHMPDYAEASGQTPVHPAGATINVVHGPVGQLGHDVSNAGTINVAAYRADADLVGAIQAVRAAIESDADLDSDARHDLIENVDYLDAQAQVAPAERRRGMLRSALSSINAAATNAPQLAQALESWGQIINTII